MKSCFFFLLCLLGLSAGPARAQDNAATAKRFVELLDNGQYEDAGKLFAPGLREKVSKDLLQGAWAQFTQLFGPYQSCRVARGGADDASVIVNAVFEKDTKGFSCNFNDQHEMVGFFVVPPADTASAPPPAAADTAVPFKEEALSVPVNGGTIKGSLMWPDHPAPQTPVALIIAGSGPTDRNGNSPEGLRTDAYKMLAVLLAENGIASYRYDKRMAGESNDFHIAPSDVRFSDYTDDAVAICKALKAKKFSKLFLLGHSEGALIGILAARKTHPAALVLLCGQGKNIGSILKTQLAANPQLPLEKADAIIDSLEQGKTVADVPESLLPIFPPAVQPYLISWMKIDPVAEIKRLKLPVLIVSGTHDLQVPADNARALKAAYPAAELLSVKDMNHVLKTAPEERSANLATYSQPELPLNKDLSEGLIRFLQRYK